MKIAFLSETPFNGKWKRDFSNARTEVAWQIALDADHFNIDNYGYVDGYDHVFVIFPKGMVYLNSIGIQMREYVNPILPILQSLFIEELKSKNKKVYFVQEGPHWLWNDYEIKEQILYYNMIQSCDGIFCHNQYDVSYYSGMFPSKPVNTIPTLMIEDLLIGINSEKQDKTIIGGNFARWYGGFESYSVASIFGNPIWAQDSHAKRNQEGMMENINHLPRMEWIDWMKSLSTFKYAVHLMPTVAAGTFSLNCAYFGIPCIGNAEVDTQIKCHPDLSIDVSDIKNANALALSLKNNPDFYNECSETAKKNYAKYYSIDVWKKAMEEILNEK